MKYKRIFLIITDGLGVGSEPRSPEFGDYNVNTFQHIAEKVNLRIPTWKSLGIGHLVDFPNYKKVNPLGYVFKIQTLSNAKDTLAGHWEMTGFKTEKAFPVFTKNGFPEELINNISKACDNRKIYGNIAASGTDILYDLAEEAEKNHGLIVYTSADSVLQICGNEEKMGIEKLYKYAKKIRQICDLKEEWKVGRIIARPYLHNEDTTYSRTANRLDLPVDPPKNMLLAKLKKAGIKVNAVGKISNIYDNQGFEKVFHSESNNNGMDTTINIAMNNFDTALTFVNLVDFDSKWGHRRNVEGYAQALEDFDIKLAKLINAATVNDLFIITSDHGNDPTAPGTDHTREYVPVTIFNKNFQNSKVLTMKKSLATIGNIIAKNYGLPLFEIGEDIFDELT